MGPSCHRGILTNPPAIGGDGVPLEEEEGEDGEEGLEATGAGGGRLGL